MLVALICLPLSMRGQDTVTISSASDWVSLCENYSGKEVNVRLGCDLILSDASKSMDDFRGTFDGQGHTLTVHYAKSSDVKAPFMKAQGTIRNLRIAGSVNLEGKEQSPLVYRVEQTATLAVESCSNEADIQTGAGTDGKNCSGGYICRLEGTATFMGCSYIGKIAFYVTSGQQEETIHQCFSICGGEALCMKECMVGYANYYLCDSGGYVGYVGSSSNISFTNCYSSPLYTMDKINGDPSYFISENGWFVGCLESGSTAIGMTNCYYYPRKTSNVPSFSSTNFDIVAHSAEKVTEEQLTSGELAMKLKGSTTGAACAWGQLLGTDTLPQVRAVSQTSLEVGRKDETTHQIAANGWSSFLSPFEVSLPESVTPYVVTGLNETDKRVMLSTYSGSIKNVPLLLYNVGDAQTITLPAGYHNMVEQNNTLRGAYETTAASSGDYALDATAGKFVPTTESHAPWQCYIAGGTADSYALNTEVTRNFYRISSKSDWTAFRNSYSYYEGTETDIYLDTDLTLSDGDEVTKTLSGNFYGQGHTITLPASTEGAIKPAFTDFNGSVSLLNVECPDGTGVFINGLTRSVTFTDCRFTDVSLAQGKYDSTIKSFNTLALYSTAGIGMYYDAKGKQGTATTAEVASGMVAYKLNGGRTGDDAVWLQTIGTDDAPMLKATSPESKEVLYAAASTIKSSDTPWTTLCYPAAVTFDAVNEVNIFTNLTHNADGTLTAYRSVSNTLPANTPAVLYRKSGMCDIKLPEAYYNESEPAADLLAGVSTATVATALPTLTIDNDEAYFKTGAMETLPAWQCYLQSEAKVINGGTIITSDTDWADYVDSNRWAAEGDVRLENDITIENSRITSYSGTFDGGGHSITVNGTVPPFGTLKGTVKNLYLTGTSGTGPMLANNGFDNLTIQDCLSSVGRFVDETREDAGTVTYITSFAIAGTDTLAYLDTVTSTADKRIAAPKVTSARAASGEIAYRLNNGRTGDAAVWAQTIGTDKVPQLALFSADSKEVILATDTVKIGSAGWSTHYYPVAKELPDGVKAYTLSGVVKASESSANSDYIVQLAEVQDSIPAYTPVLLCTLADGATETDKTITIEMPDHYYNELSAMRNTSLDGSQQYWLIGATRSYKSFNGCYVLQQQTDAKGQKRTAFYRVNENVATPTIPAWKCVLMDFDVTGGEGASNAKAIHLRLDDDETTVIGAVQAIGGILTEGQTYDLQGRKVKSLQKGQVYIKNGQKFIVR